MHLELNMLPTLVGLEIVTLVGLEIVTALLGLETVTTLFGLETVTTLEGLSTTWVTLGGENLCVETVVTPVVGSLAPPQCSTLVTLTGLVGIMLSTVSPVFE